jgi:HSP20 family molecular chaperone IbpA
MSALEPTHQRILVNGYLTSESVVLVAPMPGVQAEDVEIAVDGNVVTMRAALRTDAPKDYFLHEWDYGDYERTIELPQPVGEPITATLGNGQLAVSLARSPKRQATPGQVLIAQPAAAGHAGT